MEFTAFTARLGKSQGRITPRNAVSISGEYTFVLGDDESGRICELSPGDFAEIVQQVNVTEHNFIFADMRLRVPAGMPASYYWEVSMTVDGAKMASIRCDAGKERPITDLAANTSKLSGMHQVGVRLELMES